MNRPDGSEMSGLQVPNSDQVFTFVMEHLDWNTGSWNLDSGFQQKNNGSHITFPELSYSITEEGTHYYRVRELYGGASSKYAPDPRQFFVKVDVAATVTGNHTEGSPDSGYSDVNQLNGYEITETKNYFVLDPETNPDFDESALYTSNESQTIHKTRYVTMTDNHEVIEPLQSTVTVSRYGINLAQLEPAKTSGGQNAPQNSDSADIIRFVNTYVGKYCVAVTKKWDDRANRDGVRPDGIIVELWKLDYPLGDDGKPDTTQEKTWQQVKNIAPETQYVYFTDSENTQAAPMVDYALLNEGNYWTHVVKGVDKFDAEGNVIEYKWVEKALYFGTPTPPFTKGNDGKYSGTPDSLVVVNGTVNESNNVTTFIFYYDADNDTARFRNTAAEGYEEVSYVSAVTGIDQKTSAEDGGTITYLTGLKNTHEILTTEVEATKLWDDQDNADGLRRDIKLRLLATYTVDVIGEDGKPVMENGKVKTRTYEIRNVTYENSTVVSDQVIAVSYVNNTDSTDIITAAKYNALLESEKESYSILNTQKVEWKNLPKYYETANTESEENEAFSANYEKIGKLVQDENGVWVVYAKIPMRSSFRRFRLKKSGTIWKTSTGCVRTLR